SPEPPPLPTARRTAYPVTNIGHISDDPFPSSALTDGTSMSAAPPRFIRVRRGTRLGLPDMDVFGRGRGGRDGAENCRANAPVPRPAYRRDGIGPRASATRSTANGGANT